MSFQRTETIILQALFSRLPFAKQVLPHIKPAFFSDHDERILYEEIAGHIRQYDELPTEQAITLAISTRKGTFEEGPVLDYLKTFAGNPVTEPDTWLTTIGEQFIRERGVYEGKVKLIEATKPADVTRILSEIDKANKFTLDETPKADIVEFIRKNPPQLFLRQEISYLIEPEVPRGALIQVTGKPGCGKSTLVLTWCAQMAEAGNEILYLDRDNGIATVQDRIIERFGKNFPDLTYWGLWSKDESGEPVEPPYPSSELLREWVKQTNNPVIIFDTFAAFSSCDENDNAAVGNFFKSLRALTNLGATVILIHHTTKDGDSDYRGASAQAGAIDAGLKIVSTIVDGRIQTMTVNTFKTRLGDGKPIVYKMVDGIPVRQTMTFNDVLFDLLKQNPGLTKEKFTDLAMKANFRQKTIREFLDKYIVAGKIKHEGRKLYVKDPKTKTANLDEAFEDVTHAK
jgi:archaellum biogenesis ATPase FlaH